MESTGISPTLFWTVASALSAAVAAMAGYIVKCHKEIKRLNEDRVKMLRDQAAMFRSLKKEVE